MAEAPEENKSKFKKWLKRLGWVGFLFFFIKGLVWLAVFWGLGSFIKC
jgi:hypothetical protein